MHFSSAHKRVEAQRRELYIFSQDKNKRKQWNQVQVWFYDAKTFCTSKFLVLYIYIIYTNTHKCTRILRSFIIHSKRSLSVTHCTNHTFRLFFSVIVLGVRYCFSVVFCFFFWSTLVDMRYFNRFALFYVLKYPPRQSKQLHAENFNSFWNASCFRHSLNRFTHFNR